MQPEFEVSKRVLSAVLDSDALKFNRCEFQLSIPATPSPVQSVHSLRSSPERLPAGNRDARKEGRASWLKRERERQFGGRLAIFFLAENRRVRVCYLVILHAIEIFASFTYLHHPSSSSSSPASTSASAHHNDRPERCSRFPKPPPRCPPTRPPHHGHQGGAMDS